MQENKNLQLADQFASQYDTAVGNSGWYAPDFVFGLVYEFLKPNDKILDLGIGTGFGATKFKSVGCSITGIDGSSKMLDICRAKKITAQLIQQDLSKHQAFPFDSSNFDHIVSVGVFHLIGDLSAIFFETSRIMAENGIFSFTVDSSDNGTVPYIKTINQKSGVATFKHSGTYIEKILKENHLLILKKAKFLAFGKTDWADEMYFDAYITSKKMTGH